MYVQLLLLYINYFTCMVVQIYFVDTSVLDTVEGELLRFEFPNGNLDLNLHIITFVLNYYTIINSQLFEVICIQFSN